MNNNQQYSPPSEWIMYELGVLPVFEENDLLKVDKILGLTFFKARKDFEALLKTLFSVFHLLQLNFLLNSMFTTPIYSRRRGRFVNSVFPNKKHFAQKTKFIYDKKKMKANVCRNSTFQVNRTKNGTGIFKLSELNRQQNTTFRGPINDRISNRIDEKLIETQNTNYHLLLCKNRPKWFKAKSPLKLDLDPIFLSPELVFQGTIS